MHACPLLMHFCRCRAPQPLITCQAFEISRHFAEQFMLELAPGCLNFSQTDHTEYRYRGTAEKQLHYFVKFFASDGIKAAGEVIITVEVHYGKT